tara:strand:- start:1044 stop:1937 length:894 start_codon:yes stop_codon:yes gene_type:complete
MKIKFLFLIIFFYSFCFSQNSRDYIKQFKDLAINEMHLYNIPASITLAQGILESASGTSRLALESNNHFGIKCHVKWTGLKTYHDDDKKQECFRKYNSPIDSYRDHSLFLAERKRYAFLFELRKTDYKGWAKGLQKAGYATSKTYSKKLIELIKEYSLDQYDTKKPKKKVKIKRDNLNPVSSVQILKKNFIKYVVVEDGQSLNDIAEKYDVWLWEILKYNECTIDRVLNSGEKIYLQPKRKKGTQKNHIVVEGETMYGISQLYGVKLKSLYKMNQMSFGSEPYVGQKLNLMKKIKFN